MRGWCEATPCAARTRCSMGWSTQTHAARPSQALVPRSMVDRSAGSPSATDPTRSFSQTRRTEHVNPAVRACSCTSAATGEQQALERQMRIELEGSEATIGHLRSAQDASHDRTLSGPTSAPWDTEHQRVRCSERVDKPEQGASTCAAVRSKPARSTLANVWSRRLPRASITHTRTGWLTRPPGPSPRPASPCGKLTKCPGIAKLEEKTVAKRQKFSSGSATPRPPG